MIDRIISRHNIPMQTVVLPSFSDDRKSEITCYLIHVLSESVRDFESLVLRTMYATELEQKPLVFLMFDVSKVPDLTLENIYTYTDHEIVPLLYTDLNDYLLKTKEKLKNYQQIENQIENIKRPPYMSGKRKDVWYFFFT